MREKWNDVEVKYSVRIRGRYYTIENKDDAAKVGCGSVFENFSLIIIEKNNKVVKIQHLITNRLKKKSHHYVSHKAEVINS